MSVDVYLSPQIPAYPIHSYLTVEMFHVGVTFRYQNYRGESRNGFEAFSPQGGEASGLVGMCLARLMTYRPVSQVSWEPHGQEAALLRLLVWAWLS